MKIEDQQGRVIGNKIVILKLIKLSVQAKNKYMSK